MSTTLASWNVNGITLSGVEAGEGELVLLLHGFPSYHKTWERYMQPLGENYRVVAVDMRGYNRSSKPSGVNSYHLRTLVEDLVALTAHLGYSKVRVVGHDWGGAVAWAFAAWYPDLVSHVAVYNCPHPSALLYHMRHNFRQTRRSWYIFFFQLPWLPEFLIRRFSRQAIRAAFAARRGTFSPDDLEKYRQALLRPGVLTATLNYYRSIFRSSLKPMEMPKITSPALLIWGERDFALGAELADDTPRYLAGPYTRRSFPKSSHWSVNELVEETVPLLEEFFQHPITVPDNEPEEEA